MIHVRRNDRRGSTRLPWLDSRHTFSFGGFYSPDAMGFRSLRVINDDRIAPGGGFATHPHAEMEIVTIVLTGALEHRDSLGNGSIIRPGEVQRMSAGTGITHSEFNPDDARETHLFQIWIEPARTGLEPSYEQRAVTPPTLTAPVTLLASPDGRQGSVVVHQDALVYLGRTEPGNVIELPLGSGRGAWVHVIEGVARVSGQTLESGDATALENESSVVIEGIGGAADVLIFDLA
jgi:quercetin 2,3-dioxygenase